MLHRLVENAHEAAYCGMMNGIELDIALDTKSREKAEIMMQSEPNGTDNDSIMEFISDNLFFIARFNILIHAVVNHASVESVENLQKFMFEMAYEVARKEYEKQLRGAHDIRTAL